MTSANINTAVQKTDYNGSGESHQLDPPHSIQRDARVMALLI